MRASFIYCLAFVALLCSFTSCQKERVDPFDPVAQAAADDALILEYLKKDGYTNYTKTASGLYYVQIQAGTNPQAQNGNTVQIHYIGRFLNGEIFESSYHSGNPFTFKVGAGAAIKGWDEGVTYMQKGEKARLYIPSALAYGRYGNSNIPGNAVLVFDMEVIKVTQ